MLHQYEDYTLSFTLFRQFVEFVKKLEIATELMNEVVDQAANELVKSKSSE